MNTNPHYQPFPSRRESVFASRGMVATSHPAAADIGLDVLKKGGNAVDAAIACAAALTVLEPTSNGLGSDCFALVHDGRRLHGLNSSGWSPASLSAEALTSRAKKEISPFGWDAVTIPGAMAGWEALRTRFGSMTSGELLEGLISRFRQGVALPPTVARNWERARRAYAGRLDRNNPAFAPWFDTFAPGGRSPEAGDPWTSADQLKTLELLARDGFLSLYRGQLMEALLDYSKATGGWLERADLEEYEPRWVDPVSVEYRGARVWEIPPNGQGITTLMALGMLKSDRFHAPGHPEDVHRGIEAIKLAFADTLAYVADPAAMVHCSADLLDENYLTGRRSLIGHDALLPAAGQPPKGGTVYLAAADSSGLMVSFIQSNYMGFGSGLVVPGFGISLQNRGHNFSMEAGHPNRLEGRKYPFHTIIPGFLTRNDKALGPFGVMGGFMQPQGHLQVVQNLLDHGLNPQAALDAPRWQWMRERQIMLEPDFHPSLAAELAGRGHEVRIEPDYGHFGRGQIILRQDNGSLLGGTEKRCDGFIASW